MKKLLSIIVLLFITVNSFAQNSVSNLPKCGKYCIHIQNPCHWLLASKTAWMMGYVLITGNKTQFLDVYGNEIDQNKVKVLGYGRLQRRHDKHKCYHDTYVKYVAKSCIYCNESVTK